LSGFPALGQEPAGFVRAVVERLDEDATIRADVPGGLLRIDRPLPFLFVHRRRPPTDLLGSAALVESQASYLVVADEPDLAAPVRHLIDGIAGSLADRFGSFLAIELWVGPQGSAFLVQAPPDAPATTVSTLSEALGHVDVLGAPPHVDVDSVSIVGRSGSPELLTAEDRRRLGVSSLGIEVPPFFVDVDGHLMPMVLRKLRRDLTTALQRGVFEFANVQTRLRPGDFRSLGARSMSPPTRHVDEALAEAAGSIDYLLGVTPIDADIAWTRFTRTGCREQPTFHYRPLTIDPDLAKRDLYAIPVEDVDDPTLSALFRAKRHELERQINLLENRDSDDFLPTSLQLFGGVDAGLLGLAESVLRRADALSPSSGPAHDGATVDAVVFAERARAEIDRYRAIDPGVTTAVTVWADVPGVLVSGGDLLVGSKVRVPERRVEALIHHEIGTHAVTQVNGCAQPLKMLQVGLPGYEETQEGLAVLAEHVAGGLTPSRLATLAARVVAVHSLISGASFVDAFRELNEHWGLSAHRSFTMTMRVYRAGGLTKDAIYLRGLDRLLRHLGSGGAIEPLLAGKLPLSDIPLVEELQWRGLIKPPRLTPRWMQVEGASERLAALADGMTVLDLMEPDTR
jgi:uncharacterized protein (TIGR02421 family)